MTLDMEWKIAKLIHKRGGSILRSNAPAWVPKDISGAYHFFHVIQESDKAGCIVIGANDEFIMLDNDLDAFAAEQKRRIHAFRDWIVPTTSIIAIIILLSQQEKRLLKRIESQGASVADFPETDKRINALLSFGLVEKCYSNQFSAAPVDEYGNELPNAYRLTDRAARYHIYRKGKFWIEFRAWFTLAVAVAAFIKSFFF